MKQFKIKKTKWNLKPLFESDDDPKMEEKRKEIEKESYKFINKWKNSDDYLKDPAVLRIALDEYEHWKKHYETDGAEGYYFSLRSSQEESNPKIKAKVNKISDFSDKIANDIQFFKIRVSKIPSDSQEKFLSNEGLKPYKHFLERLFAKAKYLLSESEEKILNLKAAVSYSNWVKMTSGFLSKEEREILTEKGKPEKKSFSELQGMMNSQNKRVRDSSAKAFNEILLKHKGAAEAEINSVLADKKTNDELRGAARPDLLRHLRDGMESEAVDALLGSVSSRFDISKRYYRLKAKLMGVKKLKYHERNVPYGEINKRYDFNEAVGIISGSFGKIDAEFSEIFDKFIQNGQIDAFPGKGKRQGAFCSHNLLTQPTYVLLNYNEKLDDVKTLAHEMGHAINNEFMREKQNALNFGTSTATAEVASTFMENFALEEAVSGVSDDLRLNVMMSELNDTVSTIFRQIACYKFEQELHAEFRNKGYLPEKEIGKMFKKWMTSYLGNAVEISTGSENWWIAWSHIRMFFYVYSYAGGLLISKTLQKSFKEDKSFIKEIKEFLSAGMSDSPKNIFLKLGIDISKKEFWDNGLNEVENLLNETETLAKKIKKI